MINVLKSQGKNAVRQLIENQLAPSRRAARIAALVLRLDPPTPLCCDCDAAPQRDPRGGRRAPVCLPLPVRTSGLFGAEGDRT